MKFKYDTIARLKDESRYINVEQAINPFSMKSIENSDDAEQWMRQFLITELNAQPLFFELSIKEVDGSIIEGNLIKNKSYLFSIKESSNRLSGEYKTTITCLENNEKQEVDLMFTDGEATLEYSFNTKGNYIFDLDNDFYIGQDKFIAITFEDTEVMLYSENNFRNLSFEVN